MIVNVLTDDGTTVEIIQGGLPNVVEVFESTAPHVVEVITAGPQGPAGGGSSIDTGSFATTGSNIFYGLQTISASNVSPSALDMHVKDDGLWTLRTYNDTYSSSSIGLASWIDNTGIAFLGTETDKPLYLYNNANYYQPTLAISSSGVTINNKLQQGNQTLASGSWSHAEGAATIALGDYSHAEGFTTIASGSYSHAEGNGTIAQGNYQHVQGQFNAISSVQSAFIVGNGIDENNRSNLIYAAGNEVQISGSILLGSGSIINENSSSLILTPPGALPGQNLTIRPTVATWAITSSGFIVYGQPITVSINCLANTGGLGVGYFGTLNYEITGTGVTQQSLGRPLTGQATFQQGQATEDIIWTIPSNSSITDFTLTVISVEGTYISAPPGYSGSTTLYYNFEANGLPNGAYITVTNNGATNSEHSHVHLTSGDPTTVDLYLGDDDQYVKIEKNAGNVVIGNNLDTNQWVFDTSGSLTAPGNITATSFTGSLFGTASYAENAGTSSHILGGVATHIPFFVTDTTLATSSLYQSGSSTVIINQDNATAANPEALYVWQPHPTSFNVVSGKGDINNYLQLNIQNTNQGANASSDIVATANNGSENDNYIDMGINSQNFAGFLGGPNDSYLYSHGHNMWIGNINDGYNTYFFNSSSLLPIITLDSNSAKITGSLFGTASWATNAVNATNAANAASASRALVADSAVFATTAGNGGVTSIIAGSGITLPFGGSGAVTVVAGGGGGGVTIISGSAVTSSFISSNTWTFNHNLGTRTPTITVFDSSYNQIIPQNISLDTTSSATITFPTLESGFAIASTGGTTGTALSSSYSLFSTYAASASYFPETDPVFVAKSGSLATTGSNIFKANQTISGSLTITGSNTLIGTKTITGSLNVSGSTLQTGNNTLIGNTVLSGSILVSGSQSFKGSFDLTGSMVVSGSTTHIGNITVTGSVNISGSIAMDNTVQTNILRTAVANPSAYVIHTFPTASYSGASYMFSAIEDSTKKSTTYNVLVAQGNNKVAEIKTYLIKSEGSAPVPTIATAISAGNVELRVTDTGTFTYRGIVQLF